MVIKKLRSKSISKGRWIYKKTGTSGPIKDKDQSQIYKKVVFVKELVGRVLSIDLYVKVWGKVPGIFVGSEKTSFYITVGRGRRTFVVLLCVLWKTKGDELGMWILLRTLDKS